MPKLPIPIFDTVEYINDPEHKISFDNSWQHDDFKITKSFLHQFSGNKSTFGSYRREIERLLQWAWFIQEKSIIKLKREDLESYIQFCLKPPKSWIGTTRKRRFIIEDSIRVPNTTWRPFVATISKAEYTSGKSPNKNKYKLSQKAVKEIFTILSSFYNTLIAENIVESNPVILIKQKSRYIQTKQQQNHVRRLTDRQWRYCIETAKDLASKEPNTHERTLFILTSLYLMYLRISELVTTDRWAPQMGDFFQDSHENWWFKTVGKGNKMREIAVSDDMLKALMRYRKFLGLSPLPIPDEKIPLVVKINSNQAIKSDRQIRRLVQLCFDKSIFKLRLKNHNADADILEQATVHWLRHTGISDDINKRGRPVAHVRDDAGHASILTTDRYNDITLQERHLSAKQKKTSPK